MNKHFFILIFIISSSLLLSACGQKTINKTITPTPSPKTFDILPKERPYISLIPRNDGHLLYLKVSQLPQSVKQIEYELLYSAYDGGNEIEKGVSGTVNNLSNTTVSRELLLGTESCTNGCKYKYDEGVVGGTLSIRLLNSNNQVAIFETPFTIKLGSTINKEGEIKILTEDFSVKPKIKVVPQDYYILIKNYKGGYSVFGSNPNQIIGDYPNP